MKQGIEIETKSNPNDLVTNVDKATEKYIFDNIKQTYPEHLVIGEEDMDMTLKMNQVLYGLLTQSMGR